MTGRAVPCGAATPESLNATQRAGYGVRIVDVTFEYVVFEPSPQELDAAANDPVIRVL